MPHRCILFNLRTLSVSEEKRILPTYSIETYTLATALVFSMQGLVTHGPVLNQAVDVIVRGMMG